MLRLALTAKTGAALREIEATNSVTPSLTICHTTTAGPQVLEGSVISLAPWDEVKYNYLAQAGSDTALKRVLFVAVACITTCDIFEADDRSNPEDPDLNSLGAIEALSVLGSLEMGQGVGFYAPIERVDGRIKVLAEPKLYSRHNNRLLDSFWIARKQHVPTNVMIIPPDYKGKWN